MIPESFLEAGPEVEGNTVFGSLTCSSNAVPVINDGYPKHVTGACTGQCSGL